ncbi:hypothetical protein [Maridesulfovibrio sp.]|uniref:hypothetical protein n=1 Tax=Maridesulfovibrio sp. TaxID=2795000 RepID=UPI002AA7A934|nr:hypothetical protein [Maridesulfovibrio sp.]
MKKNKSKKINRNKRLSARGLKRKEKKNQEKLKKLKRLKRLELPAITKRLFNQVVDDNKLSDDFKSLLLPAYKPALTMMETCFRDYHDKDGNFIEQFQSTGFDARVWELYLNTYFSKTGFSISDEHNRPDFVIEKEGQTLCVEAVTTNPSLAGALKGINNFETIKEQYDFASIKMGSSLWSKHIKNYWDLPHVAGRPLVFAIECFHEDGPIYSSDGPLVDYLYGKNFSWSFNENNELVVKEHENERHIIEDKDIPSGFFNLAGSENVSAVLFSNSATAAKFNRKGKVKWPSCEVRMLREGMSYNHDPNSDTPNPFSYEVGTESPKETWGEGLIMFHNPNARFAVDKSLFSDIPHGDYSDGCFVVQNMPDL